MNIIKKERLIALALVFAMLITVYIVALYKLQIIEGEKYYEESRNNMVTTSTVTAARGNILDRYGRVLVTNKSCYDLTINTDELFPNDDSVDSNAVILKLVNMIRDYGDDYIDDLPITKSPPFEFENVSEQDQARLDAYMKANKVKENASAVEILSSMRDRYEIDSNYTAEEARIIAGVRYAINVRYLINTSDYIFVKDADMKLIATLRENNIEGINIKESYVREYATSAAAHILGYTGAMSDSDYAKYKDQGYSADATVGKDGAEYAFEKYLHGTNGTVRTTSASDGTVISKEYIEEPEPGNNVYLTIDREQEGWDGHVGFVPTYLKEIGFDTDKTALVCGPPIMIKFVLAGLEELGFSRDQVYTTLELRMKCGVGKCQNRRAACHCKLADL